MCIHTCLSRCCFTRYLWNYVSNFFSDFRAGDSGNVGDSMPFIHLSANNDTNLLSWYPSTLYLPPRPPLSPSRMSSWDRHGGTLCDLSTWKVKSGRAGVGDCLWLHGKHQVSLFHRRPYPRKLKKIPSWVHFDPAAKGQLHLTMG